MADSYDLIVIGSGPGGYVAAVRAAQLGLKTAVAEKDVTGGRCLNYACMPAKTILHAAEVYDQAKNGAADLGIKVEGASIDWSAVQDRREKVREGLSRTVLREIGAAMQEARTTAPKRPSQPSALKKTIDAVIA